MNKFLEKYLSSNQMFRRGNLNLYKIKDLQDDDISGSFYEKELTKTTYDKNHAFQIDKILKSRKRKGRE